MLIARDLFFKPLQRPGCIAFRPKKYRPLVIIDADDFVFEAAPSERELAIPGIERIRSSGHQVSVLASRNSDEVIRRARDLSAVSVEVSAVPLRDIFLETVKES